jgi:hypothetical protein
MRVDEVGHDPAGDPQVENWKGVVERVVLCNGSVIEDDGSRETTDVQTLEERCWGSWHLRGEE